jgi:hypothetical protein
VRDTADPVDAEEAAVACVASEHAVGDEHRSLAGHEPVARGFEVALSGSPPEA